MSLWKTALAAVPIALAVMVTGPTDAQACGGCFVPPEESTVVTGHRMILSVGMTQSTLYDQIEYSGDPAEFAWVLPIVGTAEIGISSDLIFNQLGVDTSVTIAPPVQDCPDIYCDGWDDRFGGASSGGLDASAPNEEGQGGVEVLAEEVVGPYETVQLASTDPNALNQWLSDNGYTVPSEIQPIINTYVNDGFNFLAMKLIPGAGIDRMAPVRITTQGSNAVLPLRMVAAGTGANTTMTLFVIGEGRYETANFPSFTIESEHVVWNYDTNESNYNTLRQQAYDASQGFGWLVETSRQYSPSAFRQNVLNVVDFNPGQSGYGDPDGQDWEAAYQAAEEDLDALFGGINEQSAHVTRLRAELSRAALGTDLLVNAADDQSEINNFIQTESFEGTEPACPAAPPGCYYYDDDDDDGDGRGRNSSSGSCTLTNTPRPSGTALGGLAMMAALGASMYTRRRRRRRRGSGT